MFIEKTAEQRKPRSNTPEWQRLALALALAICGLLGLSLMAESSSGQVVGVDLPVARQEPQQACKTFINSDIITHTTWTPAGSPYCVQGGAAVYTNITLTIQPAVEVRFGADRWLDVRSGATLIAQGAINQPITFTSLAATPAPGNWRYILAQAGSRLRLRYCDLAYAGSLYNSGLWLNTADAQVRDCRIHHNQGNGVVLAGNDITPLLQDTRIEHNTGVALRQTTLNMMPVYRNLTLNNNSADILALPGGDLNRSVTLDGPGGLNGRPIYIEDINITSGNALTLTAGTTLKIANDRRIEVRGGGSLFAEGAATQPITFTSQMTTPQPGNWRYILAQAGSRLRLRYCDLAYAGSLYNSGLWLNTADAQVRNCRIHDVAGAAVTVDNNVTPLLTGNRFYNVTTGVNNRTPATQVDARYNWWGHPSGPYHATLNPTGQGVTVTNGVYFSPWLGTFNWLEPTSPLAHGTTTLAWAALGLDETGVTADVMAFRLGASYTLGTEQAPEGSLVWPTRYVPDGLYELRAVFYNAERQVIGTATRNVSVNNDPNLAWHAGRITSDETWAADRLHIVEANVAVASGVTLTVEAGAVVKFVCGTSLVVETGAVLNAPATAERPIILTSLADDTAGGDTNLDGAATLPLPGDWAGIITQGTGQLNLSSFVDIRYMIVAHSGQLGSNETWKGTFVHTLVGDVTVPSGVTLTIEPGAIVKLDLGRSLIVNAGGTLIAQANVAQPIIFTSSRDDAVGGDTNHDGDITWPQPGDWYRIQINGGKATFNHVEVRYGAGTNNVNGALVRTDGAATLTIANSTCNAGLYTGLLAWGGVVTVTNSVFYDTDRGISAHPGSTVNVINSTVDDNRIGLLIHGGTLKVANTLVTNNSQNGILRDYGADTLTIRYSDVWNPTATGGNYSGTADRTGQLGNISADPRYKNRDARNYRLSYVSPAIDAADGDIAPATDNMGAPRYDDPRTANTGLPTAGGAYADMGAYEFVETAASNIDLVVSEVEGPLAVTAGEMATVRWTVVNRGPGSVTAAGAGIEADPGLAIGPWHDSIFLVNGQTTIPVGEVLVGEGVTLARGKSAAFSATLRVPGGVVAGYQWQVRTNARGEVFEGQNTANNTTTSPALVALDLPELAIGGTALPRQFTAAGQSHWFKFTPSLNQDVLVTLDGTAGAVELYLGRAYVPTRQEYDTRSTEWDSPDATLTARSTLPQTYYVLAYARALSEPAGFTIRAEVLDFALISVSPTVVGNTGPVTLRLRGGQLGPEMAYALLAPDGTTYPATTIHWEDSTSVYATFNLTGAASGLYDVRVVDPEKGSRTLPNAVEVRAGRGPHLVTGMSVPAVVRVGRIFYGVVRYENAGDADMVAPALALSSGGRAGLRLNSADEFDTELLQMIGVAPDGPAGILKPGQKGEIAFAAKASQTGAIQFNLTYHTAADTQPVDWKDFEEHAYLDDLEPGQWEAVWAEFKRQCGDTMGGYTTALARYATLVRQRGGNPADLVKVYQAAIRDIYDHLFANVRASLYLEEPSHSLGGASLVLQGQDGVAHASLPSYADGTAFMQVPAGVYTVTVPGYLVRSPTAVTVNSGTPTTVTVTVEPGGSITGRIYGRPGGQPIGDVSVAVAGGRHHAAVSAVDGSYQITGLEPGIYSVQAGGGAWAVQVRRDLVLAEGQRLDAVDFYLDPVAALRGTVVAVGSGAPISDTLILLRNDEGTLFSTLSDGQGKFHLGGLAPGAYTLLVQAAGYGPIEQAAVQLLAGLTRDLGSIGLSPGGSLYVTVTDERTSAPVAGAVVTLEKPDNGAPITFITTDSSGQAHLTGLAASSYGLRVQMDDAWEITDTVTISAGQVTARQYALHPAGVISGTVTDGSGQPVANIPVQILGQEGLSTLAITDANGRYETRNLPAQVYAVTVWGGQHRQEVTIDATTWTHEVDFHLTGATVSGRVRATDGSALTSPALVLLLLDNQVVATTTTDSGNGFRYVGVASGSYELLAVNRSGITARTAIAVTTGNVAAGDLRLGGLSLTGTAHDTSGTPLANATIRLDLGGSVSSYVAPYLLASVGADGAFRLDGLAPGQYILYAYSEGHGSYRQTVTLSDPGPNHVAMTLGPGYGFRGVVRSEVTGAPIAGAIVMAFDPINLNVVNLALTDADGAYSLGDLASGVYDLAIFAAEHMMQQAIGLRIEDAWQGRNFTLMPPSTLLQGQVRDTAGRPIPGANVIVLNSLGEAVADLRTDWAGNYRCDHLMAGAYTVSARADGFAADQRSGILLTGGGTTSVDPVITPVAVGPQPHLATTLRAQAASKVDFLGFVQAAGALYQYFMEHACKPQRFPTDRDCTAIPGPKCEAAEDEYAIAYTACRSKEAAYEAWKANYDNFVTSIKMGTAIFATDLISFSAAVASLAMPPANPVALASLVANNPALGALLYAGPILTSIYSTWQTVTSHIDWSDGASIIGGLNDWVSMLAGDVSAGFNLWELADTLWLAKGTPQLGNIFGWLGVINSGVSLVLRFVDSFKAIVNAADGPCREETNYLGKMADFHRRLSALNAANAACCDPRFQCCPPNDCCEPPCCQGADCNGDPPDGGGSSGGGGSTSVTGSQDPNDKATIGFGSQGFVGPDANLLYTIYFENVPTATAPAQQVVITDLLSTNLDWSSLELIGLGFNQVEVSVPTGAARFEGWAHVATDPYPVRIRAGLDGGALMKVVIESLDPTTGGLPEDPLAGFLPPNDTEGRGEGHVTFSVRPKQGLANGTAIYNQAQIVFDVNPPIDTPSVVNTVDAAPPTSTVAPLPATSPVNFTVSWSGSDPAGSGIAYFDVYVSVDGGVFTLWQARTSCTEALYHGAPDHTYSFYSVATDNVGNRQPVPAAPQASTRTTSQRRIYLPLVLKAAR